MTTTGNELFDEVRARVLAGMPPPPLTGEQPRLDRAMAVAAEVGAPALAVIEATRSSLADVDEQRRAVRVAAAQARTVAVGLVALPVVMVPFLGRLLDLDLFAFYSTPAGWAVGGLAAALLGVGTTAVAILVRRVGRPSGPPGSPVRWLIVTAVTMALEPMVAVLPAVVFLARLRRDRRLQPPAREADEVFDLVATALGGATSTGQALRAAASGLPAYADLLHRLALALELGRDPGELPPPFDRLYRALQRSAAWGAPAAPTLRQLAVDLRADHHTHVLEAAERLPALLAFPTALCLLPGSLLLVGAPLVAAGLATAGT